ncbi:hypothetical protein D6850_08825 [Roseovarius spongiae]|uniref:Regulator of SigK n=1 Tax=Roseovarius spongiae TaxID=2320272 RepID=A0A3A8AV64_9RHOB|nr:anti-sigma factor [Roseovarius spongiae]RKF14957.1 hypothetical protein D6850_08825 [Roseovarius spongiae]
MTDGPQPDRDEDRVLAGEYALGLLTPEEAAAFEERMAQDPELRALYAAWAEDFAALTDDFPEIAPPARARARIMQQLFDKPEQRSVAQRLGLGWISGGLAAAAVAAVIALNAGLFDVGPRAPLEPEYVAQIAAEDGTLIVQAAYDAERGALYVDRPVGAPAPGRSLELWLIAGEEPAISLGVLPDAQKGNMIVPTELRPKLAGGVLAISDEPEGGSPTGVATGAVLAVGNVTPV